MALLDLAEAGSIFLTRPHLADYTASPAEIGWRASDLFAAYLDEDTIEQRGVDPLKPESIKIGAKVKIEFEEASCLPLVAERHRASGQAGTRSCPPTCASTLSPLN